jgi:hypothetical protein
VTGQFVALFDIVGAVGGVLLAAQIQGLLDERAEYARREARDDAWDREWLRGGRPEGHR